MSVHRHGGCVSSPTPAGQGQKIGWSPQPSDAKLPIIRNWANILGGGELFRSLGKEGLEDLCDLLQERRLHSGELVFSQGDPAGSFYVIASGGIKIFRRTGEDSSTTLALLRPGMFFGEMGPLMGKDRGASAEAVGETVLLELSKEDFHRFTQAHGVFAMSLRAVVSRRMSENLTITKSSSE